MKMPISGRVTLIVALFLSHQAQAEEETKPIPWEENQPVCVAWQADKLFLLVSDERPVGINCRASILVNNEKSGVHVRVQIPLEDFDSGEPDRDAIVRELLSNQGKSSLSFKTETLPLLEWKKRMGHPKGTLKGFLVLRGEEHEVLLNFHVESDFLVGQVVTGFSALKTEAPSVGLGMVAHVRDPLVLHFRIARSLVQVY